MCPQFGWGRVSGNSQDRVNILAMVIETEIWLLPAGPVRDMRLPLQLLS